MADECLSPLFVCRQARWPVLPGGHRALPQLQRSPLCRAQRAHALSGLSNRRSPEQLLHLDGKMPAAARWPGRRASNGTSVTQDLIKMKTLCGCRMDLYTSSLIKQPLPLYYMRYHSMTRMLYAHLGPHFSQREQSVLYWGMDTNSPLSIPYAKPSRPHPILCGRPTVTDNIWIYSRSVPPPLLSCFFPLHFCWKHRHSLLL